MTTIKETKKQVWLVYACDKYGIVESSIISFQTREEALNMRDSLNNNENLKMYEHRAKCLNIKEVQ